MRMRYLLGLAMFAWAPAAGAQSVSISGADCSRLLVAHVPAPDVAYKPGVDAQGRAVAPADLNPAPAIRVPETIVFDIAADLRRFGVPNTSPLFQPHLGLGSVQVERDGRAFFNGQALENPDLAALREACRQRGAATR